MKTSDMTGDYRTLAIRLLSARNVLWQEGVDSIDDWSAVEAALHTRVCGGMLSRIAGLAVRMGFPLVGPEAISTLDDDSIPDPFDRNRRNTLARDVVEQWAAQVSGGAA